MEFAVRQTLRALAGQADHTADFFGRKVFADEEGKKTLRGCLERTYEIMARLDELSGQAPPLDTENDLVDPRWSAISDLDRAAVITWDKGWSDDAVRLDQAATRLIEAADPLNLEDKEVATRALRKELAKGGEASDILSQVASGLKMEAAQRGVEVPVSVLSERLYRAFDDWAEDRFTYADFREIAAEIVAEGAR